MAGYYLERGSERSRYRLEAHEKFEPWTMRCSCGYEQSVTYLGIRPAMARHLSTHWLAALLEWNLTT